jgi:hypothetical protein
VRHALALIEGSQQLSQLTEERPESRTYSRISHRNGTKVQILGLNPGLEDVVRTSISSFKKQIASVLGISYCNIRAADPSFSIFAA